MGLEPPEEILDYRWLKQMGRATTGGDQGAYRRYVSGFVLDEDDVLTATMKASRYAIGDERFRERTEDGVLGVRLHKADDGDIVWPETEPVELERITALVSEHFEVRAEDLCSHGRRVGEAKAVAVELCCRLSGCTQREVARHFAYGSESAIGKQRRKLAGQMAEDESLARVLNRLVKKLCA